MAALPAIALAFPHTAGPTWTISAWVVAAVAVIVHGRVPPPSLAAPDCGRRADGEPADLTADLGTVARVGDYADARARSLLSAAIAVVLTVQAGWRRRSVRRRARGLPDAAACMTGFMVLGRYLGLRTTS